MKYTIPRGEEFYCEFAIKEPLASVPMDVTGATGTFNLVRIGVNPCSVLEEPLAVVDGPNGIMSVSLTAVQTKDLTGRKGFMEDGYPLIATYTANLQIHASEEISVSILKVYIADSGEVCPVVV